MRPEADPDSAWVEQLSGRDRPEVSAALREAGDARQLYRHLAREHRSEGRDSYVEIDAPLELHALVRLLRPRHVVEVGVSSGVSSAYLLHALEQNHFGTLHSIDLPSFPRGRGTRPAQGGMSWTLPKGRSPGWAVPLPLRGRWDLRLGDKATVLPLLEQDLPQIDLFLYDVPHDDVETKQEFRRLEPLLSPGGLVIADHGPSGGLCAALEGWSRRTGAVPVRRTGLGLYGFRRPLSTADSS